MNTDVLVALISAAALVVVGLIGLFKGRNILEDQTPRSRIPQYDLVGNPNAFYLEHGHSLQVEQMAILGRIESIQRDHARDSHDATRKLDRIDELLRDLIMRRTPSG